MRNPLGLFILAVICLSFSGVAQKIDSLKVALKNAKHDTVRCKILSLLAETASDEEWPIFNKQLGELSELNLKSSDPKSPLHLFYLKCLAAALNNTGYLVQQTGNAVSAMDYFNRGLKIREEIGDKSGIANSLNNIATVKQVWGDVAGALEYFSKSLKIAEQIGDKSEIALAFGNIGAIYYKQGDMQSAMEYFEKGLRIQEEIGDKAGIVYSLNNIATAAFDEKDTVKALGCYEKSIKTAFEIGDKFGLITALNNIAGIYRDQKKYTRGLEYLAKSLKISEEIGDKKGMARVYFLIGEIYYKQKKFEKAPEYCLKSLALNREIGHAEGIQTAARGLYYSYKQLALLQSSSALKANYLSKSLENYELFVLMRDSLSNNETRKAMIKNQLQYEYDKKEIEIKARSKAEKEKIELKASEDSKRHQLIIFCIMGGLIIVMVFSFFILKSLRENKRKNVIITEQKHLVDEKQKEILDSIRYAKRIQVALLPHEKYIDRNLNKLNKH